DDGPVVIALEDLRWADATSLQLAEGLFTLTEEAAILLLITSRTERDHASWAIKQRAHQMLPHRTTEIALEALSGDADRELLRVLIGAETLPAELEHRIIENAGGNPFYLEELIRSLVDAAALVHENG